MAVIVKNKKFHYDNDKSIDKFSFTTNINVSSNGVFYINVPDGVVSKLKEYDIILEPNPINGKPNRIQSKSLDDLYESIDKIFDDALSTKLIESKIVLKYSFDTNISYTIDGDGNIYPNGYYGGKWKNGTIESTTWNRKPVSIMFYVKPFKKLSYKNNNGIIKHVYEHISDRIINSEETPNLHWLCSIRNIFEPYDKRTVKEIDYDEKTAKFFVDFYKSVCEMNEKLVWLNDGENITKIINSKNVEFNTKNFLENDNNG